MKGSYKVNTQSKKKQNCEYILIRGYTLLAPTVYCYDVQSSQNSPLWNNDCPPSPLPKQTWKSF